MDVIKVFDNGNRNEHYTVCTNAFANVDTWGITNYKSLILNDFPDEPAYSYAKWDTYQCGSKLGKEVDFKELPKNIQKYIKKEIKKANTERIPQLTEDNFESPTGIAHETICNYIELHHYIPEDVDMDELVSFIYLDYVEEEKQDYAHTSLIDFLQDVKGDFSEYDYAH